MKREIKPRSLQVTVSVKPEIKYFKGTSHIEHYYPHINTVAIIFHFYSQFPEKSRSVIDKWKLAERRNSVSLLGQDSLSAEQESKVISCEEVTWVMKGL